MWYKVWINLSEDNRNVEKEPFQGWFHSAMRKNEGEAKYYIIWIFAISTSLVEKLSEVKDSHPVTELWEHWDPAAAQTKAHFPLIIISSVTGYSCA